MQLHCAIVWSSTTEMTKKSEPKRWSCVQVWCAWSDRSALPSHTTTSPGTCLVCFPKFTSSKSAPYPVETQRNSSRRLTVFLSCQQPFLQCSAKTSGFQPCTVWGRKHRCLFVQDTFLEVFAVLQCVNVVRICVVCGGDDHVSDLQILSEAHADGQCRKQQKDFGS